MKKKRGARKPDEEKKDLEAELDKLRPLVENYRSIARQTPVANQLPEPLPATALQPRVYLQIVDQADRDQAKSMGAVAHASRYESAGEGVSNPASFP